MPDSPRPGVPLLVACALAGALAVPPHPVATPASAAAAGLVGLLGLAVWRRSRLPHALPPEDPGAWARASRTAAAFGLGLVVGLLLLAVIRLAIEPALPAAGARIAAASALPIWRRAVIVYVAAVGEELAFRLVLLSAIVWAASRVLRDAPEAPRPGVVRLAVGLSAIAFAAVHLPAWSAIGPLTPGLAIVILALNGFGGLVFGHVFVTRGIVAAMWAHAGADVAIQLVGPLT